VRVDTGVVQGSRVTPYYDSMLAKLIVWAPDRESARLGLIGALDELRIRGVTTNAGYLGDILKSDAFRASAATTRFLDGFAPWAAPAPEADTFRILTVSAAHEALKGEAALRARLGDDPWSGLSGWRLLAAAGSPARRAFEFVDPAGARRSVEIAGGAGAYEVTIGDTRLAIEARAHPEGLLIAAADRAFTAQVSEVDGGLDVVLDGVRRRLRPVAPHDHALAASGGETGEAEIAAPLPGMVVDVLVKEGDRVEAGQPVLLLEAMKMIHNIAARGSGVVSGVLCAAGDVVDMGRPLIRLAAEGGRHE
jgi:3-methylcrotonyl-CoA carboxylase alpha subunit